MRLQAATYPHRYHRYNLIPACHPTPAPRAPPPTALILYWVVTLYFIQWRFWFRAAFVLLPPHRAHYRTHYMPVPRHTTRPHRATLAHYARALVAATAPRAPRPRTRTHAPLFHCPYRTTQTRLPACYAPPHLRPYRDFPTVGHTTHAGAPHTCRFCRAAHACLCPHPVAHTTHTRAYTTTTCLLPYTDTASPTPPAATTLRTHGLPHFALVVDAGGRRCRRGTANCGQTGSAGGGSGALPAWRARRPLPLPPDGLVLYYYRRWSWRSGFMYACGACGWREARTYQAGVPACLAIFSTITMFHHR